MHVLNGVENVDEDGSCSLLTKWVWLLVVMEDETMKTLTCKMLHHDVVPESIFMKLLELE